MSTVVETTKYVRKPMFVDAVQVTQENFTQLADWCQGTVRQNDTNLPVSWQTGQAIDPETMHIHVRVHQPKNPKQTEARVGDWLLYMDRGYKVYTDKAFRNNFLPAAEEMIASPDQFTFDDVQEAFPGSVEIVVLAKDEIQLLFELLPATREYDNIRMKFNNALDRAWEQSQYPKGRTTESDSEGNEIPSMPEASIEDKNPIEMTEAERIQQIKEEAREQ